MRNESALSLKNIMSDIVISLQHLFIALPAIVAVPVLFGAIAGLNHEEMLRITQVSILFSGVMTLIQGFRLKPFRIGTPLIFGADMALVAIGIRAASDINLRSLFSVMIIGAVLALAVAYLLPKRIVKISPAVLLSTMLIYTISILPVMLDWFLGGVGSSDYGSMRNILVAASVLAFTLFLNQYGRGVLKQGSIALGIIFGFTISFPLGMVKMADEQAVWFKLPKLIPYVPQVDFYTILIVMPIMVVLLTKQLMDLFVYAKQLELSSEEERDLIRAGMGRNAIGYVLSFAFGSLPTSALTQNIAVNSFLQITSKTAVLMTGITLIIAGLMPKVSNFLIFLPLPVLGAIGLLVLGSLLSTIIQTANKIKWTTKSVNILGMSFLFGLIALFKPEMGFNLNQGLRVLLESGICICFFTGLFLDLVIPEN